MGIRSPKSSASWTCEIRRSVAVRRGNQQLLIDGQRPPLQFDRVGLEILERHELESRRVRSLEINGRGAIGFESGLPTRNADAPFVAWLESGETPLRNRRDQVVAVENGKIEKLAGDFHADSMQTDVFGTGPAIPVAKKSGYRIATATFQFCSEDVCRHF